MYRHCRRHARPLSALDPFDRASIEAALRAVVEARDLKPGKVFQPVRVAIAGRTVSPGIFESLGAAGAPPRRSPGSTRHSPGRRIRRNPRGDHSTRIGHLPIERPMTSAPDTPVRTDRPVVAGG